MGIPSELRAGDTWTWTESVSGYAADQGWSLSYSLLPVSGTGAKLTITTTASGADYAVSVAASTTAGYAAGVYSYAGRVSKAGEAHTELWGKIEILADLGATTSYDSRSTAAKALTKIEAWMAGDKSIEVAQYTLGDRQIQHHKLAELMALRSELKIEVQRETAAEAGTNGRRYYVRMGRG